MRIPVEIYYNVAFKAKSTFRLNLTKAQHAQLLEGKDLIIKGRFRLFKKREQCVFVPIFRYDENGTNLIGVHFESGKVTHLPLHYLTY